MAFNRPPTINGVPVPSGATVKELAQCLSEPGPIAWAAFAALSATPEIASLRLLASYARSADWRYRRIAVEAISDHVLAPEAADILVSALDDPNLYVVITGCRAVSCHLLSQAHTRLVRLLSHSEPPVRQAAVAAIAPLWRAEDYEEVKRLHNSDASLDVRKESAQTLMQNADLSTWQDLYALWSVSPFDHYRLWAVKLVHQFGSGKALHLLKGFRSDPNGHVRKAAASDVEADG